MASVAGFVLWNKACERLGVVKTSVALYMTPIVGVVFAGGGGAARHTLMMTMPGLGERR